MDHPRSHEIREYLISTAYRIVLGREPDPEGLAIYIAQLSMGVKIDQVISDLKLSEEFLAKKARMCDNPDPWHCRLDPDSLPSDARGNQ